MLSTVRSRAHTVTLRRSYEPDEKILSSARSITDGMVSLYEYDLIKALASAADRNSAPDILAAVIEKLRLALLYQSGVDTDDPDAKKLSRKRGRARVIALITLTRDTVNLYKTNVNPQLISTRLCSQYRRIIWQK